MNLTKLLFILFFIGISFLKGKAAHRLGNGKRPSEKVAKIMNDLEKGIKNNGSNKTWNRQAGSDHDIIEIDLAAELAADGIAGASSTYDNWHDGRHHAVEAFKPQGASYWRTPNRANAGGQALLWIQFKTPQHIIKYSFQKPTDDCDPKQSINYELFASAVKCQDVGRHVKIERTMDVHEKIHDIHQNEEEAGLLTNFYKYRCYGFKIDQLGQNFAALKEVRFWRGKDQIRKINLVRGVSGKAGASSVYDAATNSADEAFFGKSRYGVADSYWCSAKNPSPPVLLWFEFRKPQRIVRFVFEKVGHGSSPQQPVDYELFGSNEYPCYDETHQTQLVKTAESEDPRSGKNKIELENNYLYRCYGFKILKIHQSSQPFAALKNVEFWKQEGRGINPRSEVKVDLQQELDTLGGEAGASSVYVKDAQGTVLTKYMAEKAFVGDSYWSSKENPDLPVLLWFKFATPKHISHISFVPVGKGRVARSPQEPEDYELFASNGHSCGADWSFKLDIISDQRHGNVSHVFVNDAFFTIQNSRFRCYGFKILRLKATKKYAALKNVTFWEPRH